MSKYNCSRVGVVIFFAFALRARAARGFAIAGVTIRNSATSLGYGNLVGNAGCKSCLRMRRACCSLNLLRAGVVAPVRPTRSSQDRRKY